MLNEKLLEIIEETGKLRMQDIKNVAELQSELKAAGYDSFVDSSTDYLIVEKADQFPAYRLSMRQPVGRELTPGRREKE